MSTAGQTTASTDSSDSEAERPGRNGNPLFNAAALLVVAALSWYLLRELGPLLRPLFLAVFLCYIIVPVHLRLTRRIPRPVSVAVIVGGSVGLMFLLGLLIQDSAAELDEDLPRLTQRAQGLIQQFKDFFEENVPWLAGPSLEDARADQQRAKQMRQIAKEVLSVTANALMGAVVVGIYLLFLLLEIGHFPRRVRTAFGNERAESILGLVASINRAIASYLRVKVQASLLLAVPVAFVLWVCGVKFPVLWGVLTFLCNFIPYVGSIIAVTLPLLFAFLQTATVGQAVAAALGVLAVHLVMTYLVEPRMVGKGVGLSPLVILAALAFWGLCWGLVGMFLAVPLTVVLKIVLENIAGTRPWTRLLADE
jgi:AI-2 transport protein TqsA